LAELARVSAATKQAVLELVPRTQARTADLPGWTLRRIVRQLGLTVGRYHAWQRRADAAGLADRTSQSVQHDQVLAEERAAVLAYALTHPKDGYRRLTWQMIDEDVAYLSPSTVYRLLQEADLIARWKRSTHAGTAPPRPTCPNERWHTDLMYLRIADSWYFLVTVIDAYSRYAVHWELLASMRASDVRLVIQAALERTGATPQLVTDNGSQFTSAEFKDLVRRFAFEHLRIRTYHPESNGIIERFHRSTREELSEVALTNLSQARTIIAGWIGHYNEHRLHAGIGYLPPAEYYRGDPPARQAERQDKLARAREARRQRNHERMARAA
jgi:putative transposase